MKNNWNIQEKEGYESVVIALDDRFKNIMQSAKEDIERGGDKMIAAISVDIQMNLFIDNFPRFFDLEAAVMAIECVHDTICSEFSISKHDFMDAKFTIDYMIDACICHYSNKRTSVFLEDC